jgi:PAS domain-containing protein
MARVDTLNSWKEIADYLRRSVRTVQRWEARFGLPVRHRPGERTSVFALQAELDSWLQTRSRFRAGAGVVESAIYEAVFHTLPVALAIVNDARQWVHVNDAMAALLHRSRNELTRLRMDDVTVENDRGSLVAAWETMLSKGTVTNPLLLRVHGHAPQWAEFRGTARLLPGLHLVVINQAQQQPVAPVTFEAHKKQSGSS